MLSSVFFAIVYNNIYVVAILSRILMRGTSYHCNYI